MCDDLLAFYSNQEYRIQKAKDNYEALFEDVKWVRSDPAVRRNMGLQFDANWKANPSWNKNWVKSTVANTDDEIDTDAAYWNPEDEATREARRQQFKAWYRAVDAQDSVMKRNLAAQIREIQIQGKKRE